MLTKEFHDEALMTRRISRVPFPQTIHEKAEAGDSTAVLPLLIRLCLSRWITDKEKVLLDRLAPPECLTFLICGDTYIHPEGLELFPYEVIETTSLHGGEAIFSHRYQPEKTKESYQPYRIFSACINPSETEKIILGFFGPAHRLGSIDEDCGFAKLVTSFRTAYAVLRGDLPELRQHLKRSMGTILINRSSGRILAINEAALRVFKRPDRAMVDIGLDQFKYHLSPVLKDYNLKMDNLTAAEMGLSVVSLEPSAGEAGGQRSLLNTLSNRFDTSIANVSLISGRLSETVSRGANEENRHLLDTLQEEADRLRITAQQYCFLTNSGPTEYTTQCLQTELQEAVRSIDPGSIKKPQIEIAQSSVFTEMIALRGACYKLMESILYDHVGNADGDQRSKITLQEIDGSRLRMRFETSLSPGSDAGIPGSTNTMFVEHVAELLGIEVLRNLDIEDSKLITELILKK